VEDPWLAESRERILARHSELRSPYPALERRIRTRYQKYMLDWQTDTRIKVMRSRDRATGNCLRNKHPIVQQMNGPVTALPH
jgi:hypothetical protein